MRLLADLAGGHADGTWERRLKDYLRPDVLNLDDFCLSPLTEQQSEDLYRLVNASHHLTLEGRSYRRRLRPDARTEGGGEDK